MEDFGENTPITVMATVQYPATSATINWPAMWPANWTAVDSGIKNDGSEFSVILEVQAQADTDVVSWLWLAFDRYAAARFSRCLAGLVL